MLMVQSNAQPMRSKLKGPPPVPPRPNQSVVVEALAKTRKAVAESKVLAKPRNPPKQEHIRSKTLDRSSQPSVSPKQNGLARVKSFIRDVFIDKTSSSDGKKSSGQSSRRSSNDSCSISVQSPVNKSTESLNSKAVKTCKQILSRSLSTSSKLEQDGKCKVAKSSSFVEKTMPLRKAPPPPLSPKPKTKLKPIRPLPVSNNSLERPRLEPPTPIESPYCSPLDAKPPKSPPPEAPYATVQEVQDLDDRLRNSPPKQINDPPDKQTETVTVPDTPVQDEAVNKNNNSLESKTSRVIEMLISEILASINNNKDEANYIMDKGKGSENMMDGKYSSEMEKMKHMNNHEMLIYELQSMRSQSEVSETRNPYDDKATPEDVEYVAYDFEEDSEPNYYEMSSVSGTDEDCERTFFPEDDLKTGLRKQYKVFSTMSQEELPPLSKCFRDFIEGDSSPELDEDFPSDGQSPTDEQLPTDLNAQLKYLKKEVKSLRQMGFLLLSELWTLNETISSWQRQIETAPLERAPRRPAPPPPPPLPPPNEDRGS